jgi:hypothetical protein
MGNFLILLPLIQSNGLRKSDIMLKVVGPVIREPCFSLRTRGAADDKSPISVAIDGEQAPFPPERPLLLSFRATICHSLLPLHWPHLVARPHPYEHNPSPAPPIGQWQPKPLPSRRTHPHLVNSVGSANLAWPALLFRQQTTDGTVLSH